MTHYWILIRDKTTKEVERTVCETNDDLAKLLLNLDKDDFEIADIALVDVTNVDYQQFCKKNSELELGK